jgi:branched-chain amino acid transport system permease protein
VVVVAAAVWLLIDRTRLGLRYRVMREDADLAESTGIDVRRYQLGAFVVAAAIGALAGSLKALGSFALAPDEFGFRALVDGMAPVVVGGLSSVLAPLAAGIALLSMIEYLRAWQEYEPIVYGIVIIICYILLPGGAGTRWSWVQLWWRLGGRRSAQEAGANEATRRSAVELARKAHAGREAVGVPGEPVLVVEHVSRSFGGLKAVRDVSLTLHRGEILGLVGPNGAGKTTLINAITGFHPADEGSVRLIDGTDVVRWPVHRIARAGLRRVFQGSRIVESLGPTQNMLGSDQGGGLFDVMPARRERPIRVRNFSYGAKRWLEIARAVRAQGEIYIFDEPTTGLPRQGVEEFTEVARELASKGAGVLLVEHNVALIRSVCDRVVVLDFGQMIADGPPDAVFNEPLVKRAYLGESHVAPVG